MPELMDRIGLGEYANPSFGIYQASSGDGLFKDHATGKNGDELHLLAHHLGRNVGNEFNDLLKHSALPCNLKFCFLTEQNWVGVAS